MLEDEHNQTMQRLEAELATTNQAIEDIYTAEVDEKTRPRDELDILDRSVDVFESI